jgi:sec-independent protein translocase protein TatA
MSNFAFLDLGAPELIIILVILLLLFGSRKLPELSRSIGQSMHELRKGMTGPVDDKKETKPNSSEEDKSQ